MERICQRCRRRTTRQHRIHGYGTIQLRVKTTAGEQVVHLRNMAYVPSFKQNLIGNQQLNNEGAFFGDSKREGEREREQGGELNIQQGMLWSLELLN